MSRALVLGGYGVFGTHVSRGLAERGIAVTVAGRNLERARATAATLGPGDHRGLAADAADPSSVGELERHDVVVSCAGPFRTIGTKVVERVAASGRHWVDISDDRGFVQGVLALHDRFVASGRCAVTGASSLPGISAALAASLDLDTASACRVTLFIGNKNPKGEAAVRSAVTGAGRPIAGTHLRGLSAPERVELPAPFGPRTVYAFDSPEYDLFPARLGVSEVRVNVGFEHRAAGPVFHALARLGPRWGERTARLLAGASKLTSSSGTSAGVVLVESGEHRAWVSAVEGQRMAAEPAILAAAYLCNEQPERTGALLPHELLGARTLLEALRR